MCVEEKQKRKELKKQIQDLPSDLDQHQTFNGILPGAHCTKIRSPLNHFCVTLLTNKCLWKQFP